MDEDIRDQLRQADVEVNDPPTVEQIDIMLSLVTAAPACEQVRDTRDELLDLRRVMMRHES